MRVRSTNWAVLEGGRQDGKRELLHPMQGEWPVVYHLPSPAPGMVVPPYLVTVERRVVVDGPWKVRCAVARYVRALPEIPKPPDRTVRDYRSPVGAG